jgi:hypothetical protein
MNLAGLANSKTTRPELVRLNSAVLAANLIAVSTVAEIESAISALPVKDARAVAEWLREHLDARQPKPGNMEAIYEVLSLRFNSGERDIAARHNEHQP